MKNISKSIALVVSVLAVSLAIGLAVMAWVEPTAAPPGGNIDAPINTGDIAQTKTGNLKIGDGAAGQKLEIAGQIKITGGNPGANKVLTSIDGTGLAEWKTIGGGGPGPSGGCTANIADDGSGGDTNNRRIFLTGAAYSGTQVRNQFLADAICQSRANSAGIYKALMYYEGVDIPGITRIPINVLTPGKMFWICGTDDGGATYNWKLVASSPLDFFTVDATGNYLNEAIQYVENGWPAGGMVTVWTNFTPNGAGGWIGNPGGKESWGCIGVCYNPNFGFTRTVYGNSSSKTATWAGNTVDFGGIVPAGPNAAMAQTRALYCVQQ